ncbi:MAG: DUF2997 domain-containing protein [Smithellaceae bacterium]|jgi:hypothetical protein|nr:DUF2997 domain-containing protein [Deltaproteobacteria bacterium]
MKEIIIEVSQTGEISIETKGFKGKSCLEESQFIKNLLGQEKARKLTPAYFVGKQKTKKYLQLCG